jgi:plasmid stabilization system protein ParE
MAANPIVAPEATIDIIEGYGWYESRRIGLGEEFLGAVDACIQAICRQPERYAKVHKDYRRAPVRRFPYSVFYKSASDTVTVHCIFHTSRDPQRLRERLP